MYGTGLKEASNGKYYVTTFGNTLHVDPRCQYPHHTETKVWSDPTNTLSNRIKWGRKLRGPYGRLIVQHCWLCTVDHEELRDIAVQKARAIEKAIAQRAELLVNT